MASIREQTLNILYDALDKSSGDKWVTYSNDGTVLIKDVLNMVNELNSIPKEYIIHCITLDDMKRFFISEDNTRIGLMSHVKLTETDPYGDIPHIHNQTENRPVQPIVYRDGRFYVDEAYHNIPNPLHSTTAPYYDKVYITPIGMHSDEYYSVGGCFNCGEDHKVEKCPYPLDQGLIQSRKNEYRSTTADKKRIMDMELVEAIDKMSPGVISDELRYALGIRHDEDPPYYQKMKKYGYPPGYYGDIDEELAYYHMNDAHSGEPILKIYKTPEDSNSPPESIPRKHKSHVQLVRYPSLFLPDKPTDIPMKQESSLVYSDNTLSIDAYNIYPSNNLHNQLLDMHNTSNIHYSKEHVENMPTSTSLLTPSLLHNTLSGDPKSTPSDDDMDISSDDE